MWLETGGSWVPCTVIYQSVFITGVDENCLEIRAERLCGRAEINVHTWPVKSNAFKVFPS